MDPTHHRYRLLAGHTRSRLLAALRESDQPLGVRELADRLSLHPNSVREQLAQLVAAGLVVWDIAAPTGRGRPALRYAAHTDTVEREPYREPYRELAHVLADQLGRLPDPATASIAAGERWGRSMIGPAGDAADAVDARRRLVGLLDDAGFAPESGSEDDPAATIRLRRCPFDPLAREHRAVVCGVHLGLMQGALRELGAPLDAVGLEPFVEPDLCLAHLGARDDG